MLTGLFQEPRFGEPTRTIGFYNRPVLGGNLQIITDTAANRASDICNGVQIVLVGLIGQWNVAGWMSISSATTSSSATTEWISLPDP